MLETEAITLMTLEKIEDNFTSGIKGKRLNPCGLRNLTRGKNPRNLSLFIYSVSAIVSSWETPEGKIGKRSLSFKIPSTFMVSRRQKWMTTYTVVDTSKAVDIFSS